MREPTIEIEGELVRPFIIADNAYPLRTYMLKAFNAREEREKTAFDKRLASGRVRIENSFAILKNRWQILHNLNVSVASAAQVVTACCVLHNICQVWGESDVEFVGEDRFTNLNVDRRQERDAPENETRARREGEVVRDVIFRDWARTHE